MKEKFVVRFATLVIIITFVALIVVVINSIGLHEVETYEFTGTITHMEQNAMKVNPKAEISIVRFIYYVDGETAGYIEATPEQYARYQEGDFITIKVAEYETGLFNRPVTRVEIVDEG